MKMKKVKLVHGFVTVPSDINVIDISESGDADYAAVLSDRAGVLPPLLVISDSSFCGINAATEDAFVTKAINNLKKYQRVKAQELPYPNKKSPKIAWLAWNYSFRLGLFPIEMFAHTDMEAYQLHREEE